jgi:hypothetical protein
MEGEVSCASCKKRLDHRYDELQLGLQGRRFLASDDASFITAATFLVDGGISAAYVTPD